MYYLVLFEFVLQQAGIVLSEFVQSGDPYYYYFFCYLFQNKDLEPYPPGYDRNKRKRLRRAENDNQDQTSSATPTDATPTEATPSSADTPSALGTLENAKILAKLRCYTCIYKKYTLEEWKKFDNENISDIVKYLVVAIGSGKDYY